MARTRVTEEERIKLWTDRISSAGKLQKKWSEEFDVERLEKYYKGKQWRGLSEDEAKKKYVINLVYSTIEVNKPSLIFHRPQVRVQPRPTRMQAMGSQVEARARLIQDTVQTFIDDPDLHFNLETGLALHEAHFRFGVIEVGYSADFVDNPNTGKPILKEDKETPVRDSDGKDVLEPDQLVERENLYIKRVPATSFRVSVSSTNDIGRNDWVGYYEWHYLEDLKRNKAYNTSGLKSSGVIARDVREELDDADEIESRHGMVKVWKIWDIRSSKRHVLAEGYKKFLVEGEDFTFLPFAVMKFHEILDAFYPMPPVTQWMDPQDEINETREMQRAHRRRFYRRYTYREGSIEPEELEKLETGGDGVAVKVNQEDPLKPVQDAPLDGAVWRGLDESKSDFLAVSGVGGEQRGVAESETATQATIIDVRSRLRETSSRSRVADWLADIARLIMLTLRERMTLPFWVKRNTDPFALQTGQQDPSQIMATWETITAEQVSDIDLDVFVELSSMSPITEESERNSWNQVLAMMTNPQLLMIISMSEPILRKTLRLYGIKSENEIMEIQRVVQNIVKMQMMQAQTEAVGEGGAAGAGGGQADLAQLAQQAQYPNNSTVSPQMGDMMEQISQAGRGPEGA